jgi:ABC-type uncharacterized transport system permease subunit
MNVILLHLVPASAYVLLSFVLWHARRAAAGQSFAGTVRILLASGLLSHGYALGQDMLDGNTLHFGLAIALSLTLWLALLLYFAESLANPINSLLRLAMPPAAVCAILPALLPGNIHISIESWSFRLHFAMAMLAYSFFALAALHAVMLSLAERQLHRGRLDEAGADLPPLLVLEKILFRLIGVAFVFLTLTLASGLLFSEESLIRPLTLRYKLGFTLAAWLVFGILLLGRHVRGWRGRIAQRWTLAGFVFLLLAYIGTHFVLEILLKRA